MQIMQNFSEESNCSTGCCFLSWKITPFFSGIFWCILIWGHLSFLFWGRPNISSKKKIDLNCKTKLLLKEECLLSFSAAFPESRDWQTARKIQRCFNMLAVNNLFYILRAVRSAGFYAVTLHFWNQSKTITILKCRRTM